MINSILKLLGSGFFAVVYVSVTWAETPTIGPLPDGGVSLLEGIVETHGGWKHRCLPPAATEGELTMSILDRSGDYAMCCVKKITAINLQPGDTLLVDIDLEKEEESFEIKIETKNEQFFAYSGFLPQGKTSVKILLAKEVLRGRRTVPISKFCIVAKGEDGAFHKVKVDRAVTIPQDRSR